MFLRRKNKGATNKAKKNSLEGVAIPPPPPIPLEDEFDIPPPPPPLPEDETIEETGEDESEEDEHVAGPSVPVMTVSEEFENRDVDGPVDPDFVDYTIVPLLLRSKLPYDMAESLGRQLKAKYTQIEVERFLAGPPTLVGCIHELLGDSVTLPAEFEKDLYVDAFWTQKSKGVRGSSFVYFRSDIGPHTRRKLTTSSRPISVRTRPISVRNRESFNTSRLHMKEISGGTGNDDLLVKSKITVTESSEVSSQLAGIIGKLGKLGE